MEKYRNSKPSSSGIRCGRLLKLGRFEAPEIENSCVLWEDVGGTPDLKEVPLPFILWFDSDPAPEGRSVFANQHKETIIGMLVQLGWPASGAAE